MVLLTDGENPMEIEDWEATVKRMNDHEIQLFIVSVSSPALTVFFLIPFSGADFDDDEMPFQEENKPDIKVRHRQLIIESMLTETPARK